MLLVAIIAIASGSAFAEKTNPWDWPAVSLGALLPHEFLNPSFLPNELESIAENADFNVDLLAQDFVHSQARLELGMGQQSLAINSAQPPTVLSGAPGETVTLDLRNLVLRGQDTFTLQGTSTTKFIINVSGKFSLLNNARIVLAGGVQWNNVFFNVLGRGSVVVLSDQSILYGALTASKSTVRLEENAIVYGKVVAKKVLISGAAQIVLPPVVSN